MNKKIIIHKRLYAARTDPDVFIIPYENSDKILMFKLWASTFNASETTMDDGYIHSYYYLATYKQYRSLLVYLFSAKHIIYRKL